MQVGNDASPLPRPLYQRVVGVDDGYSDIKICGSEISCQLVNGSTAIPGMKTFGSVIERGGSTGNIDGRIRNRWQVGGETFTVAPFAAGERLEFDHYHWSPENQVLIYHYLASAGWSGKDIDLLVVGLPMSSFFELETGGLSANVERKIANLRFAPVPLGETIKPPRSIGDIIVRPQGLLSFFDYCVDWNGRSRVDAPPRVAVIDIGGRTTDLAFIVGGAEIDRKYSKSINIGVLNVCRELNAALRDRYKVSIDFPLERLKLALRTGRVNIRGTESDVGDLVDDQVRAIGGNLWRQVQAEMEGLAVADLILLVGGGASVFDRVRPSAISGVVIPQDPEYANVRGMWKFGFCRLAQEAARASRAGSP